MKFNDFNIPATDLDFILNTSEDSLIYLNDKNILITGATGFIGKWIIESLVRIRILKKINFKISILSRNNLYRDLMEQKGINFILGDIVSVKLPKDTYDLVIHGAAPSVIATGGGDQLRVKKTIEEGTQNLIEQLSFQNNKPNFLFLSSGAVYGKSIIDKPLHEELIDLRVNSNRSLYGEGKLYAENLVRKATESSVINGCSPRLFAFSGPYLTLNEHFAFGNFILNAINNEPFYIRGNPNTQRSYLYVAELITWIFKSLLSPTNLPINFGSELGISIFELAQMISRLTTNARVIIEENANEFKPNFYVPDISNAKQIYSVKQEIFLEQQISKYYNWARN